MMSTLFKKGFNDILKRPFCRVISNLWVAGKFKQCCENDWPRFTLEIFPAGQETALVQKCCFLSNVNIYMDAVCLTVCLRNSLRSYYLILKRVVQSFPPSLAECLAHSRRLLSPSHLAAQRTGRTMQVPCDTEYPAFISERTIKENTGNIDCDGCIKYGMHKQTHKHQLATSGINNKSRWLSAVHHRTTMKNEWSC